jgi:hypothetical protein
MIAGPQADPQQLQYDRRCAKGGCPKQGDYGQSVRLKREGMPLKLTHSCKSSNSGRMLSIEGDSIGKKVKESSMIIISWKSSSILWTSIFVKIERVNTAQHQVHRNL